MLAALDALRRARAPTRRVNVALFLEGEEEAGSPHLERFLQDYRDQIAGDAWLLCDGPVHQSRRMQVYFGARGVTDLEVTLYGPSRPLHSGHYGNWAPNPALELAHLVAALRDVDGPHPGRPASTTTCGRRRTTEKQALREVPDVDEALRGELALARTEAGGARLVERILLPALNVRGLAVRRRWARRPRTPSRRKRALRSTSGWCRTRRRTACATKVEAHLRKLGYDVVHGDAAAWRSGAGGRGSSRLAWGPGYPAARTSMDLPVSRALIRAVGEPAAVPSSACPRSAAASAWSCSRASWSARWSVCPS